MGKKDNKDIFENIENSEPVVESHQEEHVEVVFEPEPEPVKEIIPEPIKKAEPIVVLPLPIPVITPKKNPDKLRQIKNNPKKYY